jgi:uncharacterized BrkB/YihY/UPF0761 family membrane protein
MNKNFCSGKSRIFYLICLTGVSLVLFSIMLYLFKNSKIYLSEESLKKNLRMNSEKFISIWKNISTILVVILSFYLFFLLYIYNSDDKIHPLNGSFEFLLISSIILSFGILYFMNRNPSYKYVKNDYWFELATACLSIGTALMLLTITDCLYCR